MRPRLPKAPRPRLALLLAGLLLLVLGHLPATPVAASGPFAYIPNKFSNTVSVIDTGTNTVAATIGVGQGPVGVAVTPDGSRVYVTNVAGNSVSVIDASTRTVIATVPVGFQPQSAAVSPDGSAVYVTNSNGTVSVISAATNTVVATVGVGSGPQGLAVTPDGSRVYVANQGSNSVSAINAATNTVAATVGVASNPVGVAVTPDGHQVYVAGSTGTVSAIDTSTNAVTPIFVGGAPAGVAITPDGAQVYVTISNNRSVAVINTTTHMVTYISQVGGGPWGVAVNPAGARVYVANSGDGTVAVIDRATNTVVATIPVGSGPLALGQFIQPTTPDTTPPTVTITSPTATTYPRNQVVNAAYTCADEAGGSGLASCVGTVANGAAIDTSTLGSKTFTVTATDNAGNTQTAQVTYTVVDVTKPTVTITSLAATAYPLGQTVTAAYSCADEPGGSGLASCVGTVANGAAIDTGTVGSKIFTVTAKDNAGNTQTVSVTYTVIYSFAGFFAPIDNAPTLNAVKAGSAVPVTFSLGGNQGLAIFASGSPSSAAIVCDSSAPVSNDTPTVAAGGSSLSYNATTDQYTYIWKTDAAWTGTCRQLVLKLIDGATHVANFQFK